MSAPHAPELATELFTGRVENGIAVVRVRDRLLVRLADLAAKGAAFDHIKLFTGSESVRALVILDPHQASRKDEYLDILTTLRNQDSAFVARLCNAANQTVTQLATLTKPVVAAGQGRIVSLLLNMGLAADYRIASQGAVFVNPGLPLGLPSKGGAAFFLSRLAGPARAMEFMLCQEEITAGQALEWGIVNELCPEEELERVAMAAAARLSSAPAQVFSQVKRMLAGNMQHLNDCLAMEDEAIVRRLNDHAFWTQVEQLVADLSE